MNEEIKKENKLYNLDEGKVKIPKRKDKVSKEGLKKMKVSLLIIFGIFVTIFLFGGYIFHTYDIEYSNTAFEKQDLEDCYIN